MNKEAVRQIIHARAKNLVEILQPIANIFCAQSFYICGGSLGKTKVNDIDIYPCKQNEILINPSVVPVFISKNAKTYVVDGCKTPIQVCNYFKPNLQELIKSFDFSSCQAGVKVTICGGQLVISDVEITDELVDFIINGEQKYNGSEYPLSSLIRFGKYSDSFKSKSDKTGAILDILSDIVERGFKDYKDFKDQLDAIDLALEIGILDKEDTALSKEDKEAKNKLIKLFNALSPENERRVN